MSDHTIWSPSSAPRRVRCLGSANAEAPYPETSSEAADEGTAAHRLFEVCVKTGTEARRHIGKKITVSPRTGGSARVFVIDHTMSVNLQEGLDIVNEFPGKIASELRVSLEPWLEGQHGTLDIGGIADDYFMIMDLKYGFLEVDATENEQLMLYALAFWNEYVRDKFPHITRACLRIFQPRLFQESHIKEYWVSVAELLEFGQRVRLAFLLSQRPDAPRTPGEKQCHFCKAFDDCHALATLITSTIGFKDGGVDMESEISVEDRSQLVRLRGLIVKWLDRQTSKVREEYLAGKPTPGLKVVDGRNNREWDDEDEARWFLESKLAPSDLDELVDELLSDDDKLRQFIVDRLKENGIMKKQLISPAEAEKVLGKESKREIADYVRFKRTQPQVVPVDDKRSGLLDIDSLFDDIGDDDDLFGDDPYLDDLI